jgi:hypothetical protein
MLPRPRFRLPIWAAIAIVAAVYVVRSVLRGMDFTLDWPADAIVLGLFAVVVVMVAYVRNVIGRESPDEDAPTHNQDPPAP